MLNRLPVEGALTGHPRRCLKKIDTSTGNALVPLSGSAQFCFCAHYMHSLTRRFMKLFRLWRYLKARDTKVDEAATMLRKTIQWRRNFRPSLLDCEACHRNPGTHSIVSGRFQFLNIKPITSTISFDFKIRATTFNGTL